MSVLRFRVRRPCGIGWWLAFVISLLVHAVGAQEGNGLGHLESRLQQLHEDNRSAMVRVKAVYPPEDETEEEGAVPQVVIGSGFFISREGLILTNASIVSHPLRVWVEHQSIAYGAEVIGMDEKANVAFLRIHRLPESFTFLHLSDRAELPRVGSFVLRLSMPLEFGPSPRFGLVSGHESRFGERFFPCVYIRTSIPAGPGDGGAAYLDLSGRLLGIQVGSLPDIGSSYVLPARAALRIRDDILFNGEVTYGWIGFEVEVQSSVREGRQLLLSRIFPDTPAADSGLMEGDVLLRIGDFDIASLDDLRNAIFYTRVGQYVDVRVQRDDEERIFSIKIAARPEDEPMEIREPVSDMQPGYIASPIKERAESGTEPTEEEGNSEREESEPES